MSATRRFIEESAAQWQAYTEHEFVCRLADGSLPPECFRHYLKQDYLFLHHYARALALGMYKSGSFNEIRALQQSLNAILDETLLHVGFCAQWGLAEADLLREPESAACVAYTRYVLDCGMQGTLADLYAALAPCVIGYAEIGRNLAARAPWPTTPIRRGSTPTPTPPSSPPRKTLPPPSTRCVQTKAQTASPSCPPSSAPPPAWKPPSGRWGSIAACERHLRPSEKRIFRRPYIRQANRPSESAALP